MTLMSGNGTAANVADYEDKWYPGVPYESSDFHTLCELDNVQKATIVGNCEVAGSLDLDQVSTNSFTDSSIFQTLDRRLHTRNSNQYTDLNTDHGFPEGSRPFIYQEVSDLGTIST